MHRFGKRILCFFRLSLKISHHCFIDEVSLFSTLIPLQNNPTSLSKNNLLPGKVSYLLLVFCLFWAVIFGLYYPAAKAGFVADYTGWLDQVKNHSFREFINRTHFQAKSLYQLTQFNTWVLYKLLGTSQWLWHLVFVTMHAINGCLLFLFFSKLMDHAGIKNSSTIAAMGALLFCVSPYFSEVIVWEPSFHFLQGLMLIMLILLCAQVFITTANKVYAYAGLVLYFLSLFSLEIFYITPWLVLSLCFFYNSFGKVTTRTAILWSFVPMIALVAIRFLAYRLLYGDWVSRIGSGTIDMVTAESFGKPIKYLFHLLFMGRFLEQATRQDIYSYCDSLSVIVLFYGICALVFFRILFSFQKMSGKAKTASLLFVWMMMALLLLTPLWFQPDMLVWFDRYTYFAGAFFYMLVAVSVSFITVSYVSVGLVALFALLNMRYTIKVARLWGKSGHIVTSLLHNIPDDRSKKMILLNLPQCMMGVPMIGAEKNSEYKMMHDLLVPEKILTNTVYDGIAYNMLSPTDGAHVNVINDSMVKVTLNQWGTWWWMETKGGYSYWTSDYNLDLKDPGHWYILTLRKPADQFMLLFNVGDQWKVVDMSKKEVDQN